jgi:anti-anti-sigma factor
MNFSISERRHGSVVILDLNGRLVMGEGSEQLDKVIQERIQAGVHSLILDCGKVPAIDSQGIKALVRGAISLQKRDGKLVLVRLTPRVREVLELTRLLTVLEAYDDDEAAVRSVSNL